MYIYIYMYIYTYMCIYIHTYRYINLQPSTPNSRAKSSRWRSTAAYRNRVTSPPRLSTLGKTVGIHGYLAHKNPRPPVGPYSSPMPKDRWSYGGGCFL